MCRSTEDPRFYRNSSSSSSSSRRFRRRNRLDIKTFSLRFSILDIPSSSPTTTNNKGSPSPSPSPPKVNPLPGSLTLHYLPRISGSPLDINDSPIPSDSPAFVTLYQVMMNCRSSHSPSPLEDDSESIRQRQVVVFASRERISASEGVQFEVYWREEKVLKGVFRRNEEDEFINIVDFPIGAAGDWTVDCRCTLESHPSLSLGLGFLEVSHAQVCIEIDGHGMSRGGVISSDKVDMAEGMRRRNKTKKSSKKKKKNKSKSRGFVVLEEIPEEREVDDDSDDSSSSSSCTSCCCGGDPESELRTVGGVGGAGDGEEEKKQGQGQGQGLEMEIEGVRWAVDVGIWVLCLGVGYLVTRASSTTFPRRRRPFFF